MVDIETRIALLLTKAESTTPEEAEALTEHAERLMVRHGIDQARIEAARAGSNRAPETIETRVIARFDGVYADAFVHLGFAITRVWSGLGGIRYAHRSASVRRLALVGFPSDIDLATTLITSLCLQARTALDAYVREQKAPGNFRSDWRRMTPAQRTKARRDFIVGFGYGAAERFKATQRRVHTEEEVAHPGTAVAILDRQRAVEAHIADMSLRSGRSIRVGGSYADGMDKGRKANVGGATLGGRRALSAS